MANDVQKTEDTIWENTRTVSDGSMTASNEQLALISFVYRLGSLAANNESSIANENDVRKEARLLMSLSCSSPMTVIEESTESESGRVTPQSDVSMCSGTSSRRNSFSFACPSLSLENHSQVNDDKGKKKSPEASRPAVLLGRVLKVDDMDAMRLSSEAMARNIMQSYQKAIDWRIRTWIESLSTVLVNKEMRMKAENVSEDKLNELLYSSEARLLLQLQSMREKVHVLDARTSFKVLPQRVTNTNSGEPIPKRRRLDEDDDDDVSGLEETEYEYEVAHALALEVFLNIQTPGAGYVQIDLQVPGLIKGTFLSNELESELLTDVRIELNTDILASMIEKSSRMVVRSSVQALLERVDTVKMERQVQEHKKERAVEKTATPSELSNVTPKRKHYVAPTPAFVTPRDSSPPASVSVRDSDKPLLLSIPDNFNKGPKGRSKSGFSLHKRPCSKVKETPQVVTPLKQSKPSIIGKGKGPNLPVLVEVACAAMNAN